MKKGYKFLGISTVLLIFLLNACNCASAGEPFSDIAEKAQKAYADGQYHYAIELYDSILKQGYTSAALYYNIGNAYFKTNQMPYAIWYYEKARKLAPGDESINFNLNLANTLITDKIDALPKLFYVRWWQSTYGLFNTDTWAKISIILVFLIFIFLAFFLIARSVTFKKLSFFLTLTFFILAIFTLIFAGKQYSETYKQQSAIVFSPRITAKSSPDENSIDLFVIHEGTKVIIQDNLGEWCEIKLANGNVGWIKKSLVKTI
ncbi:MAG: hypothetical protein BWY70_00730 [Bacteroidetes bacterium ADurb.Bin408]|nr:MAG: hypothetical protein BWY70_00730 [Bacteroidetes bacterium ADurb.Bin408]